jgi:hypothetical protein
MSCRNIETIMTELARGQMLEARAKKDALAHMENCQRCASRFADEQTLTSGLSAVAASAAVVETPARVEAALLSAFRQGAAPTRFSAPPTERPLATPWLPWSIAAAAAILIFSVFALPRLLPADSREVAGPRVFETPAKPSQAPANATPESAFAEQDPGVQAGDEIENQAADPIDDFSAPRPIDRRRAVIQNASVRSRPVRAANNIRPATATNEEIATEFLPLTYGSLSQLDDGQVVRVELPRSALQSFGLPVNAERAGERVKADVLLGHDGVARAIRFVR